MAGLADLLGPNNPFQQFVSGNRGRLGQIGAGLASGQNFAAGLSNAAQMQPIGAAADDAYAASQKAEAERQDSLNQTIEYMRSRGYDDLVAGVSSGGMDMNAAWAEVGRRDQPAAATADWAKLNDGTLFNQRTGETMPLGEGGEVPVDPKDAFGFEKDLYSQYSAAPPVKLYQEVKSGYERVRTSAVQNTGAGDVGLIYGYMKMLDPGSVVREGEFATAESTAGVPQQIVGLYNKLISGERLTPQQKAQFVQAAEGLYGETVSNLEGLNSQFSTRAQGWNVNPGNFIVQPETFDPVNMGAQADPLGLR